MRCTRAMRLLKITSADRAAAPRNPGLCTIPWNAVWPLLTVLDM